MSRFLYVIVLFLCISCQEKHEKVINEYLDQHLKDPGSYECVELGTPKLVTPMSIAFVEITKRASLGEFPMDSVNSKLDQAKAMFEKNGTNPYDTLGWSVEHTYRAKNSYGAYELSKVVYTLNKDQSEIIKIQSK